MPFRVTVSRRRDESTGRMKRSLHLPPGVREWELRNRRYRKLFHSVYVHRDTSRHVSGEASSRTMGTSICPSTGRGARFSASIHTG
jgi:hypothetical protein